MAIVEQEALAKATKSFKVLRDACPVKHLEFNKTNAPKFKDGDAVMFLEGYYVKGIVVGSLPGLKVYIIALRDGSISTQDYSKVRGVTNVS